MSFAKNRTPSLAFPHTCFSTQFHALIRGWNPGEGAISAKKGGEDPETDYWNRGCWRGVGEGVDGEGESPSSGYVSMCGRRRRAAGCRQQKHVHHTLNISRIPRNTKLDKKEMCMSPCFICMKMFCFGSCAFERDGRKIGGWKTRRGCWRKSPSSLPLSNE